MPKKINAKEEQIKAQKDKNISIVQAWLDFSMKALGYQPSILRKERKNSK